MQVIYKIFLVKYKNYKCFCQVSLVLHAKQTQSYKVLAVSVAIFMIALYKGVVLYLPTVANFLIKDKNGSLLFHLKPLWLLMPVCQRCGRGLPAPGCCFSRTLKKRRVWVTIEIPPTQVFTLLSFSFDLTVAEMSPPKIENTEPYMLNF